MATSGSNLRISIDASAEQAEKEFRAFEREVRRSERALSDAYGAAEQLDRQLQQESEAAARKTAQAHEMLGRGLVAAGAAMATGLGLAVKAASDWETAWAGVTKTVDGSEAQMSRLQQDLRDLTEVLPASHQEIAAVAEAAGQLGVGVEDVAAFTQTMINLGETTNLSAEEAATSLARVSNIMGTMDEQGTEGIARMGATIVELGNNSATTEAEIVELATRLAAAGSQAGISESDLFAFASALTSVGVQAQAGGTSMSKVFTSIGDAVRSGGEELDTFAEVAGVTSDEFQRMFEQDPAMAIAAWIDGMGRMASEGENTSAVFQELGLTDQRLMRAVLSVGSAQGLLNDQLLMGRGAWEDNSALVEEARKRYETAESRFQIARNSLVDLGIDIGSVLLPALVEMGEALSGVIQWLGDLPRPVQQILTVLGTAGSAASLAAGGFLLLAPRVRDAIDAMQHLGVSGDRTTRALRGIGRAARGAAGIGIASAAIYGLYESTKDTAPSVAQMTEELLNMSDAADTAGASAGMATLNQQLAELQETVGGPSIGEQIWANLSGGLGRQAEISQGLDEVSDTWEQIDAAVAGFVTSGNMELAEEQARNLYATYGSGFDTFDAFIQEKLPGYADALTAVDNEQRVAAEGAEGFAGATGMAGEAAGETDPRLEALATAFNLTGESASEAAQEMLDAWAGASEDFINPLQIYQDALAEKEQAEQDAAQATADSTEDASDSWEDYANDVALSFEEYLAELEKQVEAQENWATNMAALAGRVSESTLDELAQMGPEAAPLIQEMVNATDAELAEMEDLFGRRASSSGDAFSDQLSTAALLWPEIAARHGEDTANQLIQQLRSGEIEWEDVVNEYGHLLEEGIPDEKNVDVSVLAPNLDHALGLVDGILSQIPETKDITISSSTEGAMTGAEAVQTAIGAIPTFNMTHLEATSSGAVNESAHASSAIDAVPGSTMTHLNATAQNAITGSALATDAVRGVPGSKTTTLDANNNPLLTAANIGQAAINAMHGTTEVLDGDNEPLRTAVHIGQSVINAMHGTTETLDGDNRPLRTAANIGQAAIDAMHGTTETLDGNSWPLRAAVGVGQAAVNAMHGTTETLDGNNWPLRESVMGAQSSVNSLEGKTVKLNADASALRRSVEGALDTVFDIAISAGGVGGIGGGGAGASRGSGGRILPAGSYRFSRGSAAHGYPSVDLAAPTGTPVFAPWSGMVSRTNYGNRSYGRMAQVHGSSGTFRAAHLSGYGASGFVSAGTMIGRVGSTGNSTGPHLHAEVLRGGRRVEPRGILRYGSGGPVIGKGGPRDDEIPAMLSNGEFVMKADARALYGDDIMHAINNLEYPKMVRPEAFAMGGPVGQGFGNDGAAAAVVQIDYDRLAHAMANVNVRSTVELDGRAVAQSVERANNWASVRRTGVRA